MRLRFYQIDAFTRELFKGNPAGVVPDAHALDDAQMQAIARELNVSETAFVLADESSPDEIHVRFFTPTTEIPVCGHATIATHFVRSLEGARAGTRRQRSLAGVMQVETRRESEGTSIWMHQRDAQFGEPIDGALLSKLLKALGLAREDLMFNVPVQVVCTGHSKVLVPVRSRSRIATLTPALGLLSDLSREIGCNGFYPFTLDQPEPEHLSHGRMFAPAIGIDEDPVTGNASGCLGAYLLHHRVVAPNATGELRFTAGQGAEMGRPGSVEVEAAQKHSDGSIAVCVGGSAVVAYRGELELA